MHPPPPQYATYWRMAYPFPIHQKACAEIIREQLRCESSDWFAPAPGCD